MDNNYIVAEGSLVAQRFWAKVDKKDDDSCWIWTGAKDRRGYGRISNGIEVVFAHRLAWVIYNKRPIPSRIGSYEAVVRHLCGNGLCVNPKHLKLGTPRENGLDIPNYNKYRR